MRTLRRTGWIGVVCLLTACHSSMPPRVSQPMTPAPRAKPASAATAATAKPSSTEANLPNSPKVITVESPQAEFAGNAIAGIDPNEPIETNVQPKNESIVAGTTKPYIFNGETITPMSSVQPFQQTGLASWYGKKFHGRKTASGEIYNMYKLSAAHRTLPIPSYVQVTNLSNQKSVIVRVNDRGPFTHKRVIDLSYAAAKQLDMLQHGSAQVDVRLIDPNTLINPNTMDSKTGQVQAEENLSPSTSVSSDDLPVAASDLESGLYVQAGAFSLPYNAKRLYQRLAEQLPDIQAQLNKVYNGKLHQVVIGPYPDQAMAAQMVSRLREQLQLHAIIVSKVKDNSNQKE